MNIYSEDGCDKLIKIHNNKIVLDNAKKIHFIGIGGVSMHSLALYMSKLGKEVSGSDHQLNEYTKVLQSNNIHFFSKHNTKNVKDVDVIIKNGAIPSNNKELKYAQKHNIPILDRSELLQYISTHFKCVIAIAGTHGKSSTCAMLYKILSTFNKNTSCHIGGNVENARFEYGDDYLVIEACEYNKSFLNLTYDIAVVTNVERDHIECYGSFTKLKKAFEVFLNNAKSKVVFYSRNTRYLKYNEASFVAEKISVAKISKIKDDIQHFSCLYNGQKQLFKMSVFGLHNVKNALLAIKVSEMLNVPVDIVRLALQDFKAVGRRCEIICQYNDNIVLNDYAHHPTEIHCCLQALKTRYKMPILCIFQPHTYSRTKLLLKQFLKVLKEADDLIIFKEYPARESKQMGFSAKYLYKIIKSQKTNVKFCSNKFDLKNKILKYEYCKSIIAYIGAGDIENIGKNVIKKIQKNIVL